MAGITSCILLFHTGVFISILVTYVGADVPLLVTGFGYSSLNKKLADFKENEYLYHKSDLCSHWLVNQPGEKWSMGTPVSV